MIGHNGLHARLVVEEDNKLGIEARKLITHMEENHAKGYRSIRKGVTTILAPSTVSGAFGALGRIARLNVVLEQCTEIGPLYRIHNSMVKNVLVLEKSIVLAVNLNARGLRGHRGGLAMPTVN